ALLCGSVDARLDSLMRRAISAAKRVRAETALGHDPVGFGHVAVQLALEIFGALEGRSALLVGAGKMARTTARLLADRGVQRVDFSTRTPAHAVALAEQMPARVMAMTVPFARIEQ